MTKQLLIYGAAEAVNKQKHKEWSVKSGADFSFASEVISVPLTAVEFIPASQDFAIVFSGEGDNIMPVAVMGVRENENLYIKADGSIDATYAPAFLRRYPFVFSSNDDGSNFTLCIDEGFEGCNQDNRGERLTISRISIAHKPFVRCSKSTIYWSQWGRSLLPLLPLKS
jgi:hypothetical protein